MSTTATEVLQPHHPRDRIVGMNKPKHLFILKPDVVAAIADDESRVATLDGLREMDLYRLPYEQDVYVQTNAADFEPLKASVANRHLIYGPMDAEKPETNLFNDKTGEIISLDQKHPQGASMYKMAWIVRDILIVALATRNAHKVTTENKLAKLGIGKSKFRFTTTISLPREMENDPDNPPSGTAKAPHLRRGHIRRQHYGQGNALEKKIWIAPVFVNADPAFVNARKSYIVRM